MPDLEALADELRASIDELAAAAGADSSDGTRERTRSAVRSAE
jgi:hypothetical protein